MRIYLFLPNKIMLFSLQKEASGSFGFDFEESENKLINVEAKNDKWYLHSTDSSKVITNNEINSNDVELIGNSFYVIQRKEQRYLIYVTELQEKDFIIYSYDENINLSISNKNGSNILYSCPYINDSLITIKYESNRRILNVSGNNFVYVNKKRLMNAYYEIQNGDEIAIYGLKMIFLNGILLINRCGNRVSINEESAHLIKKVFSYHEEPKDIEIKDVDLYDKDSYFSKSPRLRRLIETEEINISPPPKENEDAELPTILTVGPMLTMGITSAVTLLSSLTRLYSGEVKISNVWPSLVTSLAMLISMMLWPALTKRYNKKMKEKKEQEIVQKYNTYLQEKRNELMNISKLQKDILTENLLTTEECLKTIMTKSINLWDKRVDQNDFLVVRIGVGDELLDAKVSYSEEDFTIEESALRKSADEVVEEFKYIRGVPIGYSFLENKITAIMGADKFSFMNNLVLQLLSFYSYEDLKFVVFTNDEKKSNWEYMKYLNHTFTNAKDFRFFASNEATIQHLAEVLNNEVNNRLAFIAENNVSEFKTHYFIIIDNYDEVKRYDFIKNITETNANLGFSIVILEERLSKLPSKCNNFISLGAKVSGVLKNSFEKQEQIIFQHEIIHNIDMMKIAKILSNIPIEFEQAISKLPDSINFLEMEKVGKVEQLNILNRWNNNDATTSLKAEVGVDENGSLLYLDLHEKAHGPHGLIAGTTGSGKSEFIITYILSMCINYSPDDVAFILIDYKGGGLALAFENKVTGVVLPHLAGTITNLDKVEMDRTLVSIDSEVKRRQKKFNEARDTLGESTIDIYKYQKHYKEGRLKEPIPHLFIVCDEFAELKSQQPEFMDNLISVARIGRSLGVHLILATQKPSGVVNDQIWSNSKFKVCLKVQDEADSKEMLKCPDAAGLKQTGRFYLLVGYNEYFVLGQSGWCGAKYYPSDEIEKQVDKSINFIDDNGMFIKSIKANNSRKVEPQGEQIGAIMNTIIEIAKAKNKRAQKLWLDNIPEIILVDDIEKKYQISSTEYNIESIIGEYDAPEQQVQGCVKYNYLNDGNTIIYGNDGSERENLLTTMIYSATKNHKVEELNFYIIDYGSETLRKFEKLPHTGGIVYAQEEEKYNNLFKLIRTELQLRKKTFADYGGEYQNYVNNSGNKLPVLVVIFNNYDSIYETNPTLIEELPEIIRDSERYGIVFILTANSINSIHSKISQNCKNVYAFKLKDNSDYQTAFGAKTNSVPRDTFGRGLYLGDAVHEFQTAKITANIDDENKFIIDFINKQKSINNSIATKIKTLPEFVRMEDVQDEISDLYNIPIGISKNELDVYKFDVLSNIGNLISTNKLKNADNFMISFLKVLQKISNIIIFVIDPLEQLSSIKEELPNYCNNNFDQYLDTIINYINKLKDSNSSITGTIVIYGVNKFITKLNDTNKMNELMNTIKQYEKISVILVDEPSKIKGYSFETWFTGNFSINDGIWIGKGMSDQVLFHLTVITRDMQKEYKNDMGYAISESSATLCKFIDFVSKGDDEDDK